MRHRVLVCDRVLEAMVGPELRAAGIDCRFEPEVPAMEEILAALADLLFGSAAAAQ